MFEENLGIIKNCFLEYVGTGAYTALYCLAVLYILMKEEDKKKKALFVLFPILVLILVMNPLFNKLVGGILKKGAYWRVFWMIPLGITIAYAAIKIIDNTEKKIQKVFLTICFCGIIALGGKNMYSPGNFLGFGNLYKLPDEAVYVTQLIGADKAEYKKALVSYYLAPYIRQIDASIELTYARSATPYSQDSLAVRVGLGEVDKITATAKSTNSNYIVMHKETPLFGEFEDYGYKLLHETTDYRIYKLQDEEEE